MIDWLIAACRSIREYFTYIEKHRFQIRVAKIKLTINISHLLFRHTLFQALKLSSKGLSPATHRLYGYDYMILSFLKDLSKTERWPDTSACAWLHPVQMIYKISCGVNAGKTWTQLYIYDDNLNKSKTSI